MGRKRKDNALGLPERVYHKHGAFYYVHPGGKWERLGTDLKEAKQRGRHYNDPDDEYGTVAYWLDEFIVYCEGRVGKPKSERGISQRTYADYSGYTGPLKAFFGKMLPEQVEGHHVGAYLDLGAAAGRAVQANREKACLSACFSWLRRKPDAGVKENPCFGIARNPEQKRERYVEHEEYQVIYKMAKPTVRFLMELMYRTLQRPEDIIQWTSANIIDKREPDGTIIRVLRTQQDKTAARLDIMITPELASILDPLMPAKDERQDRTLLRSRTGEAYTYDGLSSMLRRYIAKAVKEGGLAKPFAPYDIKGKGATDMWLSGKPLEEIQQLCGHDSVTTTERYVKCRWRGTITPNKTAIFSSNIPSQIQQTSGC
ncbi:tyrosine-type recombinase/integrase [Castellaniella sp.]|uniref:tyrosine-type recombinase/integrase n=1 Tax=Castellaniella sp. TaxID=1955812 RepID=UPI003C778C98